MTTNTFGMHIETTSKTIHEVCKAISQVLGPLNLRLQKNQNEMNQRCLEFEVKYGMPQAFGYFDGTHAPIKRPTENSQGYFCYKMFYSLNVQRIFNFSGCSCILTAAVSMTQRCLQIQKFT